MCLARTITKDWVNNPGPLIMPGNMCLRCDNGCRLGLAPLTTSGQSRQWWKPFSSSNKILPRKYTAAQPAVWGTEEDEKRVKTDGIYFAFLLRYEYVHMIY